MIQYLANFSASFKIALLIWPFIGVLLTVPLLAYQYVKYHRLPLLRVAISYLFILYAIGVFFAFTLYPFPDDFAKACSSLGEGTQLIPFYTVVSLVQDTGRAVLQILLNMIFFLPLGVFLRSFWGRKLLSSTVIIFACSLSVELLQLTHILGILPCQYRLFDVDDLIVNTIGGVAGYTLAKYLPDLSNTQKFFEQEPNRHPGPIQRLVTFLAEYLGVLILCSIITVACALAFYDGQPSSLLYQILMTLVLAAGQLALPLLKAGFTPLSLLTNSTLDDKERTPLRRLLYYCVRFAVLWIIFIAPTTPLNAVLIISLVVAYPFIKKPLYALI